MVDEPRRSLVDEEARWRALLFSAEPVPLSGVDGRRQLVYRRLVRATLRDAIEQAAPHARRLVGRDAFDALVARFLQEAPPASKLLTGLPGAFTTWAQALPDPPHASFGELVHYECLDVDVLTAPDADAASRALSLTPTDASIIEAHPSARLVAYRHAVHEIGAASTTFPRALAEPAILVVFRAAERVERVHIAPVIAKVLAEAASGATLASSIAAVEAAHGAAIDGRFVRAALVDLAHRGALIGFRVPIDVVST